MAKRKKPTKPAKPTVPVCNGIFTCDSVVVAKDDSLTVIRIIDTSVMSADPGFKAGDTVEVGETKLVIMLKAGGATGQHEVTVYSVCPTAGTTDRLGSATANFDGVPPHGGRNIISTLRLKWRGEGLYWLEVRAGGKLLGKTPFVLKFAEPGNKA